MAVVSEVLPEVNSGHRRGDLSEYPPMAALRQLETFDHLQLKEQSDRSQHRFVE